MTELDIIAMVGVGLLTLISLRFIVKKEQEEDKEKISELQTQIHTFSTMSRWVRDVDKARCTGDPCRRATDKIFKNSSPP